MILQLVALFVIVLVTLGIIRKWVKKEVDNKLMQCPNCRSSRIYPETDAIWSCANCSSFSVVAEIRRGWYLLIPSIKEIYNFASI